MVDVSKFLNKNTDEVIAISVVIPGMTTLSYLTLVGVIQPEVILIPISMILVHYFRKTDK